MILALAACAGSDFVAPPQEPPPQEPSPQEPPPSTGTVTPSVVAVSLVPADTTVMLGSAFALRALKHFSDGHSEAMLPPWSTQSGSPLFSSSSNMVLAVNTVTGAANAVGPGTVQVSVRVDGGLSASGYVTVLPAPGGDTSSALRIVDFRMVEFTYVSLPSQFFYAPQVSVMTTGLNVTVLTIVLDVPGIGRPPTIGCGGLIAPGAARDLNGEVYGDYTFTVDSPGKAATGAPATVILTFIDAEGNAGTVSASGPIVRGNLPTTYTGGGNGGACFHGYVPPG